MAHTSDQSSPPPTAKEEQNQNTAGDNIQGPTGALPMSTTTSNPTTTTSLSTATSATLTTQDPEQDRDFDPSAEALIDEIDDERTLEEEEALAGADSAAVQNEIDDLRRESEMPIEELLAYYQRMREDAAAAAADNDDADEEFDEEEDGEEEEDEEEEDENVEDESDEVRKKQADSNVNKVLVNTNYNHRTDERLAQQPTQQQQQQKQLMSQSPQQSMQQTQLQQVHPQSNSQNLLIPSSPRQRNQLTDVSLINDTQHAQTAVVISGGLDPLIRFQSPTMIRTSNQDLSSPVIQNVSTHHPHPHQHIGYHQSLDEANTVPSTVSRNHKHSMTEFLVDSETAASGIFKTLLDYDLDDSDDLDEDYSYTDDENGDDEREWRRVIHVGPEFQAAIPEGLSDYENDLPPYENEDTLVWRCNPEQNQEQILDYLKQASMIPKRKDISISLASVPKISDDNVRLYRERMLDIGSVAGLHPIEHNHENINTIENPPDNLHDVYMSQSRKRLRIDIELEQENAMDGINQPSSDIQINHLVNTTRDDNSNSVSQDNRPELSTDDYFQDEEQLLYLLLQCNHNFEEAIRRRRLDPFKYYISEPMSLWSQDECLGFEHGLRIFGKNFRSIRDNKVPTRTRSDVVAFYYLWKKSERHDVYTNQYKLDRKRCLTHPGTTDYMDRFIEDNESVLNASSSTPTPTPTERVVVNQISHISHVNNQAISICRTSEASQINCMGLPEEMSIDGDNCNEINHQSRDDDSAQGNSFYVDSNTPI